MLSVAMLNVIMLSVAKLNVIMLSVIMLNVIMLNVIMLNVIMLSVIMLSVIMLNVITMIVVAPNFYPRAVHLKPQLPKVPSRWSGSPGTDVIKLFRPLITSAPNKLECLLMKSFPNLANCLWVRHGADPKVDLKGASLR